MSLYFKLLIYESPIVERSILTYFEFRALFLFVNSQFYTCKINIRLTFLNFGLIFSSNFVILLLYNFVDVETILVCI